MKKFFRGLLFFALSAVFSELAFCGGFKIEKYYGKMSGSPRDVVSGCAIVKFKAGTTAGQISDALSRTGFKKDVWLDEPSLLRVELPEAMSVAQGILALGQLAIVEAAEPDGVYKNQKIPNDPYLNSQYGLSYISATPGWEFETGVSSPALIAIVDSGIDGTHPDIKNRLSADKNAWFDLNNGGQMHYENPPTYCDAHGSHVAGIAAAQTNNAEGVAGVAWGGEVVSLRIFQSDALNCDYTSDTAIYSAVKYISDVAQATGRRAVVNMSLGGMPSSTSDICSISQRLAVDYALSRNVVLVAAAGNYAAPDPTVGQAVMCPARIPGVIAVSAFDQNGKVTYFSARGPQVAVSAPGSAVFSINAGDGYVNMSGTSMSAPFVAGAVGLLLSAKPTASATTVINWLENSADPVGGFTETYGYGRLNVYKALRLAVTGSAVDPKAEEKMTAFPNPFRPGRGEPLTFLIPASLSGSDTKIRIYNMNGDLVRSLAAPSWDGKNEAGLSAASGVYIFYVETSVGNGRGRFALIK